MSPDFLDRRRAKRFAQLIEETNGGPRSHIRGHGDEQLAELVSVGQTLTRIGPAVQTVTVEPEFRSSLRAMLVATADREGIGVTAQYEPTGEDPASARWRPLGSGAGRRLRARGAIIAGVAVGAVAISGMSFASEDAVPGDALYGVKRSTEKAQLALAGSDVTRGQLFLGFARNRLAEAAAMQDIGLDEVLADMDNDSREGVKLLNGAAVQRRDEAPLNAVDTFVSAQRRQLGPLIDGLNAKDREKAIDSLRLLDEVDKRVRGLRNSFACGTDGISGADSLGPKPRSCSAADSPKSNGTGKQTGSGAERGSTTENRPGPSPNPSPNPSTSAKAVPGQSKSSAPGTGVGSSSAPAGQPLPDQPAGDNGSGNDNGLLDHVVDGVLG